MAERASDVEPIDYTIGSMDIDEQLSTFDKFMGLTKWSSLGIAGLLLFLTVWFGTDAGFFGGFIAGAVLMVLGFFFLKAKNASDRPH
jgi:thiamine transporter ThiT